MNRLKELRRKHKMKQSELCNILGIAQPTLSGWENNKFEIDNKSLLALANYFHVSIDYILGRDMEEYDKLANPELPALTDKDKRDISKDLDKLLNDLNSPMAFYNGEEKLDDDTRELLTQSLKTSVIFAKQRAKQKFTPKKYREKR